MPVARMQYFHLIQFCGYILFHVNYYKVTNSARTNEIYEANRKFRHEMKRAIYDFQCELMADII